MWSFDCLSQVEEGQAKSCQSSFSAAGGRRNQTSWVLVREICAKILIENVHPQKDLGPRFYSVVVITPDFDHKITRLKPSGDPGSNPGKTSRVCFCRSEWVLTLCFLAKIQVLPVASRKGCLV